VRPYEQGYRPASHEKEFLLFILNQWMPEDLKN
jgi:hypothetical protein